MRGQHLAHVVEATILAGLYAAIALLYWAIWR
jgi:hypothetical protein